MTIDTKYNLKKFFMELYRPVIVEGNNIKNNEYITTLQVNDKTIKEQHFKNIDDLVEYLSTSEKYYYNTYFNLSTTDGKGRTTENQKTRTCLVFDIDKKDLNINELQELCNQAGLHLHYHLIVMSGNGYHVYVFIEPTDDLEAVEEVQRAIALRLKADLKATLKTQVMRVPNTFNIKDINNKRKVYIFHKEKRETIKRKTIEHFKKQLKFQKTNINTNKIFKNFGSCKRLDKYIEEGCEGESRHEVLLWIQNKGKQLNLTESQINIAKEKFNEKANMSDFEYQSKYVSNKANGYASCIGCNYKTECKKFIEEEFIFTENDTTFKTNERIFSKCKKKGTKKMNGNMLVIYGILKLHNKGLFIDELQEEITYRKKRKKEIINVAMKERTLRETLKELKEQNLIKVETVGKKNLYKINTERSSEELKLIVRASVVYDVVKGFMTPEELQFYCFLRYLQNEQRRLDPNINGNKLIMVQEEIAKRYGVTRQYVNELISDLECKKYIRKEYRQSKQNQYDYCIYYLVH